MRRGVDFAQAELATKIRGKYLRALEEEQFDAAARPQTYVKGFLRTYAEYLGLDGQLYVDEYNSRFVGTGDEHEPRTRRSAARPQRRHRRIETNVVLVALAAIAIVMVVVISAWKASDNNSPTAPQAKHRPRGVRAAPAAASHAHRRCAARRTSTARVGTAHGERRLRRDDRQGRSARSLSAARRLWLQIDSPENLRIQVRGKLVHVPGLQAARDHRHAHRLAPRVRAAIVASGSELVRGDRQDRNGPYLAASLLRLGIDPVADHRRRRRAGRARGSVARRARRRPARRLGRSRPDARRPHDRAARAGGRRGRSHVDEELAGEIEALLAPGRRAPQPSVHRLRGRACASRRRCRTGRSGWGSSARHRPSSSTPATASPSRCPGPPRELQELWPRVLETEPLRRAARARAGSRAARAAALRRLGVGGRAVPRGRRRRRRRRRRDDLRPRLRDPRRSLRRGGRRGARRRARGGAGRGERAVPLLARRADDRGARARPAPRARA